MAGIALVSLLAGCSSSGPNLAQDQANVNRLTALVAADESAFPNSPYVKCHPSAPPTTFGEQTCDRTLTPDQLQALQAKARQKVDADKFSLQVAQDQLRKDENG